MPIAADLTGVRFGRLTATAFAYRANRRYWHCQCDCGDSTEAAVSDLRAGKVVSCGCLKSEKLKANESGKLHQRIDLTGEHFGRLVVLGFAETIGTRAYWSCRCECGKDRLVCGNKLRSGHTTSCGCSRADSKATHGATRLTADLVDRRLYGVWREMIRRCERVNSRSYAKYGARGITVCERWRQSFAAFLADMGRPPSPGLSIDRIDNSRGYSPDNCRWASSKEQSRNRRDNVQITVGDKTQCLTAWAEDLGMSRDALRSALRKAGQGHEASAIESLRAN